MNFIKRLPRVVLLGVLLAAALGCARQDARFPSKPITIVVPWSAGGGTDALARSIANQSSPFFGVPVNVVNRPGGTGAVGHSYGANARPDGYTVTMITYELCTYKPLGRLDLTPASYRPVMQLNEDPAAITVQADAPWKSMAEFIEDAKKRPGEITIGNSGPGAVWHIGALKLERITGAKFTHIPHPGAKPAVTQLLGGHIDAVAVSPAEVLQYLELDSLRCLGVMAEERDPQLPDVPTLREQGIDLVHGTWRGLAVPPDTPDDVVAALGDGFYKGFQTPEFQQIAKQALIGLRYRGAADFKTYLASEFESAAEVVRGIQTDVSADAKVDYLFMPKLYAGLLALLALILAARIVRGSEPEARTDPIAHRRLVMAAAAFVSLIAYAALMFVIGYVISTLAWLIFMMVYMGEKRPARLIVWSVAVVLVVLFVFRGILDVPLPVLWG
ncbi:MAG: tripartite tricarboxylate transporter substrate binding protein [bacterium]|nr:tripartite tricarboxylate transporter substrate binding protein [bacterium]